MKKILKGYSTLVTVVLLLAFMTVVMIGISALSITSLQSGYQAANSGERLLESESCIEEILRQLKEDSNYAGGNVILSPALSCTATINGTETQKTITATMSAQNIQKTITIGLDIVIDGSARNFRITSWDEQ